MQGTDPELLERYVVDGSEDAFRDLVNRYINMVYAAALRRVGGDAHLAHDVAQQVFTALSRASRGLRRRPSLAGWLYTTTRNVAGKVVRTEARRRAREQRSLIMNAHDSAGPVEPDWDRLRPFVDDAMDVLGDADREAVLLRFFERRSYAEIGLVLRTSEDAARVRVSRALGKLHASLAARGVTSTVGALAAALTASASPAAPAHAAAGVAAAALAGAQTTLGTALLGLSKAQLLAIGSAAVVLVGAVVLPTLQDNAAAGSERPPEHEQNPSEPAARGEPTGTRQKTLSLPTATTARPVRAPSAELDRLNREGNALVDDYNQLARRAADEALTPEQRADARAAAASKVEAIHAKSAEARRLVAEAARTAEPGGRGFDRAGSSPTPTPGKAAEPALIALKLPDATVDVVLSTYEHISGMRIERDPSLATVRGHVDLDVAPARTSELLERLETALREQAGIVLEHGAGERVVAKRAGTRP